MTIREIIDWANGFEGRHFDKAAAWRSSAVHLGLAATLSELLFRLALGHYGLGITMGFVGSVWAFFAYRTREYRQEAQGIGFEPEDLIGPALNMALWFWWCVMWWTLWLIGG
jgi:hypothetical protein